MALSQQTNTQSIPRTNRTNYNNNQRTNEVNEANEKINIRTNLVTQDWDKSTHEPHGYFKEYIPAGQKSKNTKTLCINKIWDNDTTTIILTKVNREAGRKLSYFVGALVFNQLPLQTRKEESFVIFKNKLRNMKEESFVIFKNKLRNIYFD